MSPRGVPGKFTDEQKAELRRGFVESREAYEAELAAKMATSKLVSDLERERHGTPAEAERELYGKRKSRARRGLPPGSDSPTGS